MSAGIFAKKVTEAARSVQSKNLESINFARLGTMKVVHKDTMNNKLSVFANMVILGSAMIGIVFSYMTYHSMIQQSDNDYDIVMNESHHDVTSIDTTNPDNMTSMKSAHDSIK
jgi:methylthioribose-1-phosphate isomerase